jgi:hypothetical protein
MVDKAVTIPEILDSMITEAETRVAQITDLLNNREACTIEFDTLVQMRKDTKTAIANLQWTMGYYHDEGGR